MKKKIKLFSTIASLCLAVALMAFGVWAATAGAKFNVGSTVTFTADEYVYGEFKVELEKKVSGTLTAKAAQLEIERTRGEAAAEKEWALKAGGAGDAAGLAAVQTAAGYVVGEDNKFDTTGDYYQYTFTFTNKSPYNVKATPTMTVKDNAADATLTDGVYVVNLIDGTSAGITVKTANAADTTTAADVAANNALAPNASVVYTIRIELTSSDVVDTHAINFLFGLDLAKAQA